MATTARRTRRFEARTSPETLAAIKRAAEITGRSAGDFVTEAAREAAVRTIEEMRVIRLSLGAQEQLAGILDNPRPPGPALRRAFEAHAKLIRSSE